MTLYCQYCRKEYHAPGWLSNHETKCPMKPEPMSTPPEQELPRKSLRIMIQDSKKQLHKASKLLGRLTSQFQGMKALMEEIEKNVIS